MPDRIPGSPQYWKSFGLDLIAMTHTRGLPSFFVTLSENDAWPHVQATIRDGWGAAEKVENVNLSEPVTNWQSAGGYPKCTCHGCGGEIPVVYEHLPPQQQGRTTRRVVDYVWKQEYQKHGAVHWHMLLRIEPGTIPDDAVVAEMP